jgi:hypothetical protein
MDKTILQEYDEKVALESKRYTDALKALREELYKNQDKCKKHNFIRYEELFYAIGQTAPGYECSLCGKQKRA